MAWNQCPIQRNVNRTQMPDRFELFQYGPVDQIQKCNKQMHLQPENTTTEHEFMFRFQFTLNSWRQEDKEIYFRYKRKKIN